MSTNDPVQTGEPIILHDRLSDILQNLRIQLVQSCFKVLLDGPNCLYGWVSTIYRSLGTYI